MNICIMAGGSGKRLWPKSRKNYPKQFLNLISERSMFQETVLRVENLKYDNLYVICNEEHRFLVAEQLRELGVRANILLEPTGKNTAPAIAIVSHLANKTSKEPMLVLSADHYIGDSLAFCEKVNEVIADDAINNSIVLFGITPEFPSSEYGYIQPQIKNELSRVSSFKEKPSKELALEYIDSDDGYLWNSGMFMFTPKTILNELHEHASSVYSISEALVETAQKDADFIRFDSDIFYSFPDVPIDIAVLEKSKNVFVYPFDIQWSDVGTWGSLHNVKDKDHNSNSFSGDVIDFDTTNCLVNAEDKLVVTLGVSDLVVVETSDAVMISTLEHASKIGCIANKLSALGRTEHIVHREVNRPWGKYDAIDNGARYQVKRITVKPGGQLSLQMHHHRAEHWIVVKGTAKVTNGEKIFLVSENESTYIPLGTTHRLENPGNIELEMIEVQSGSYLGEDDIVRFNDIYNR